MANPFDQFDTPQASAPKGNVFDQFDAKPQSAATPVASGNPFDKFDTKPQTYNEAHPVLGKIFDVAEGLKDSYQHAVTTGIFSQPARYAMEHLDNPVTGGVLPALGVNGNIDAQLKQRYPGKTQQWYDQQKHDVYGGALEDARNQTGQAAAAHPHGGIVGDFATGMVANPQNLLIPGGGVGKTLAGRLASAAGANALGASVEDDAAQIMDIAEGQQKSWDVNRSLQQAAFGAGFGVVAHGALHEVPSFVSDLFKTRGLDTTPNADPRGATSPLTGDQPTMTPEQHQQLAGLIKTGSVDDIKGFLADKQGPKPTWSDVNKLVQTRDAIPETLPNAQQAFDQHINDTRSQAVQDHIGQTTAGWKNAPDVQYHNDISDIQDPGTRTEVQAQADASGQKPPGFFGSDGKVHIFPSEVHSPEMANALLFHEGLGHFGLAQKFGDTLDTQIGNLLDRNVSQFGKKTEQWQADHPGAYGGDKVRAGEEVLAEMSEKGQVPKTLMNAVAAHVRRFGRNMGMKLSYSDAEVQHVLSMAHDAVVNGKGRDVRANGFRSPLNFSENAPANQNKFMFTGPKAAFHDPLSPDAFMTRGGDVRNEISDHEAYLRPLRNGDQKLGDVLHHPDLFEMYPQLADVNVKHGELEGLDGGYDPTDKSIHINRNIDDTDPKKLKTVLHETQHAIQHIEGNIKSDESNMASSDEEYNKDPREIEARLTEDRANYDDTTRRAVYRPKFMDPERLKSYGVKDIAEEAYDHFGEGYTPKYRSWEDAKKAAADTALDPSVIKDTRGVGNLDRKLFVYDNAAKEASAKMLDWKAKMDSPEGMSHDDEVQYALDKANFHYVIARLDNDAGQVGRALNAMKQMTFRRNNLLELKKLLEEEGDPAAGDLDPESRSKFLTQFAALHAQGNPAGATRLLSQTSQPYWWQYALTWRNNMMLSALSTHLKSSMDMATTAGRELEEKIASLPAGAVRGMMRAAGMKGVEQGTDPAEIAAHFSGLLRAVASAEPWKEAAAAFKNSAPTQRFGNNAPSPRIPGLSKVTDAISAQDAFFRNVLTNAHLNALGAREARQQLGPKASFDDRMTYAAGVATQPSRGQLAEAQELASQTMLMNRSPLNDALDRGKRIRPGMNGMEQFGSFITNYFTPFVRVQSNALVNQLIRRSPLSILDPVTRADWAAGGSRRDVAVARTIMGTALLAHYWMAADPKNQKTTGLGPENASKLKELEGSGWSPSAVHENGQYSKNSNLNISLNPLDLHNNTASLVAGVREAYEAGKDSKDALTGLKLAGTAIMHDLVSQTYVNDIGEAWESFSKTGESGAKKIGSFLASEARSFLPNATTQAAKIIDPIARDASDGIGAQFKQAIPGLSKTLPARQSVYGDDVQTGTGVTGIHTWLPQDNHITGGNHTDETTDPSEKEMARLGSLFKEPLVGPVQKTISGVDTSNFDPKQITEAGHVKLTTEQFEHYQHVAGVEIKETMRDEMQSPEWGQMSDEDKATWLRDMAKEKRKAVKEYLYGTK